MIRNTIIVAGSFFLLSCMSAGQAQDGTSATPNVVSGTPDDRKARLAEAIAKEKQSSDSTGQTQNPQLPGWISFGELIRHGRPDGGYRLGVLSTLKREQRVCKKVLKALNKERPPIPNPYAKNFGHAALNEILMGSDLSIDWTYIGLAPDGIETNSHSRALVDIDNDGDLDTVYRYYGVSILVGLVGYEGFPPEREDSISLSRVAEIHNTHKDNPSADSGAIYPVSNSMDQSSIPESQRIHFSVGSSSLGQFADVLKIRDSVYILRGGSITPSISTHPVPLRLFRASTYKNHKFLCEFIAVNP